MRRLYKIFLSVLVVLFIVALIYLRLSFRQNSGLPGPLRGSSDYPGNPLTPAGILSETNRHRQIDSLPPLILNPTLSLAAENKLKDMFTKQYFDHDSPDGVGPADVVDRVGYKYLRVGENLALGNFTDDADLVRAWMDSPGHRANILSRGFSEIGIAATAGQFDGQSTWLAVQTFSLPVSACPEPETTLQQTFNSKRAHLEQFSAQLSNTKEELQRRTDKIEALLAEASRLSDEGNAKISRGNAIIKAGSDPLAPGAQPDTDSLYTLARQLQQDGQELVGQAVTANNTAQQLNAEQATQLASYNSQVDTYNQLNDELAKLADQFNVQVRAYNECADQFLD